MTTSPIELLATCWTSAGDVKPLLPSEVSPVPIAERVQAVAASGWSGIGLAQDDLRVLRDGIGFAALRELISTAGLRYTEVELLTDWWETGDKRVASDDVRELLFDAAQQLGAVHIKIGTAFGDALESIDSLVTPLQELADDAARVGVRLALEPMPFSMVASIPMGADLIRAVNRPNCGLLVDSWHVFRAGTTVAELRESLTADIVFGVELDDAADDVVGTLFEDTRDRRLLCGDGGFDLDGMVRALVDMGWRGPWGVEIISDDFRALEPAVALEQAHRTASAVISAALQ